MIEIYSSVKGEVREYRLEDIEYLLKRKSFFWIRTIKPDEDEQKVIFGLLEFDDEDKEDLKDFLEEGDRPRAEKEDFVEIIYSVPRQDDGDIKTEPLAFYIKKNFVITAERKKLPVTERISGQSKKNKMKFLYRKTPTVFVSQVIDSINDDFLSYLNKISSRTDLINSKTKTINEKQIDSISSASTTLAFFHQSIMANVEVLNSLRKLHHKNFNEDNRDNFNDIYYDALQILDAEKVQRELIMNIFNMQSIISSNQMNNFMKKLTSFALIIMIPTLITGIYGMNIEWLPYAKSDFSFHIVVAFMVTITIMIYVIFRKIDWV